MWTTLCHFRPRSAVMALCLSLPLSLSRSLSPLSLARSLSLSLSVALSPFCSISFHLSLAVSLSRSLPLALSHQRGNSESGDSVYARQFPPPKPRPEANPTPLHLTPFNLHPASYTLNAGLRFAKPVFTSPSEHSLTKSASTPGVHARAHHADDILSYTSA